MSDRISGYCEEIGVNLVGMIPYDTVVSKAMVEKKIMVEYGNGTVSDEIKKIWLTLADILGVGN
jgi:MinD superfamily P-loop ATPase